MSMSSSQARYLALQQRMSDVEYEGQQINQARLNLSRETSDLTTQLLNLPVATPPVMKDYIKTIYTTRIGATECQIDSVVPNGDRYNLNLRFLETGHYLDEVGTAEITNNGDGTFTVGSGENEYPVLTYAEAYAAGRISESADAGYLSAFMNRFPSEFTDQMTPDEMRQKISVYFTTSAGSTVEKTHFMRRTDVEDMLPEETTGWATVYDYIPNGQHDSYHYYENCGVNFGPDARITSIELPTSDGRNITYQITYETVNDENAYNDAFAQYTFDKNQYDQKIEEINKKTELIQRQDKYLESCLTDLDTQRNALKTEMEAVKKVVQDAVEGSFKTFSG